MAKRNCGNCDYCAENGLDLVCVNEESEYLSDFVELSHVCEDWQGTLEDEEE
jgi:hypothetical protein